MGEIVWYWSPPSHLGLEMGVPTLTGGQAGLNMGGDRLNCHLPEEPEWLSGLPSVLQN